MDEKVNEHLKSQDFLAFTGIIETIQGDLKYAFSQFDISKAQKQEARREILATLTHLTIVKPEEHTG